jgi:hypothetical protein
MSASNEKDRMVAVGIYKAPANLSKEEFETKITSFVDRMLAVPIAQKNFLKFEIVCPECFILDLIFTCITQIYQNELLNQHMKAFDLPEAPTSVWLTVEFEVSRPQVEFSSVTSIHSTYRPKHTVQRCAVHL